SFPARLKWCGSHVYFQANDGVNGVELWKTDGTAAGTEMVKDINPGSQGSNVSYLTEYNGTLIFAANDDSSGHEIWISDGTSSGTNMVKNIGSSSNMVSYITNVGGVVYFFHNDGTLGTELYTTDGTAGGTKLLRDINTGPAGSSPAGFTELHGNLIFTANDGLTGLEVWESDGTVSGTDQLKNVKSGSAGSSPTNFASIGGSVYFLADNGVNGPELWRSVGTNLGTRLMVDINPTTLTSNASVLGNLGDTLLIVADNGQIGIELYRSVCKSWTRSRNKYRCEPDSILFLDTWLKETGTYVQTYYSEDGCDSVVTWHLTVFPSYQTEDSAVVCYGRNFIYPDNSVEMNVTQDLVNTVSVPTPFGCDSFITFYLTVDTEIIQTVVQGNDTLTADETDATYQWVDCNNDYAAIPGETNQQFVATENGFYAVELTKGNCIDTTACKTIVNVGLDSRDPLHIISVFPNPVENTLSIGLKGIEGEIFIELSNSIGQVISRDSYVNRTGIEYSFIELPAGLYNVRVYTDLGSSNIKVIKQ
ncbi:MAG: T9SS type A sorting domain-containing protein, partial [Bacteroidetes bacterium]|nr:T9SS type A sorting domain-containing protein [Bacteroidota bacterium]